MKATVDFFRGIKKPIICCLLSYLFMFLAGCASQTSREGGQTIIFRNVTVIDAVNGLRTDQAVAIRGNMIVDVGPDKTIKESSDDVSIDCRGKYMIPGLWDAHMHLTNSEVIAPVIYQLFLVNGITYIRDTAGELHLLKPLLEKALQLKGIAPEVFFTGPHLDGLPLSWSSSIGATSVEHARQIMDSLIAAGVDQIKVYELLPPEIYFDVLERAKRKGLKVSGHVPLTMDAIDAANGGLSSIEHLNNLELSMSSDWDSLLAARQKIIADTAGKTGGEIRNAIYKAQRMHAFETQDETRRDKVLQALAKNETWQVPTLVCVAAAESGMYERDDYLNTFNYIPEPARTEWKRDAAKMREQPLTEVELAHSHWAKDIVRRMTENGIGIMAGTDSPLFMLTPGFSLHEELALLVQSGLTPLQAIEAATMKPAMFFGLENQQGSIAEGMLADLVILNSNPLEDINNTKSIDMVMRNGQLHTREDLDKILRELENPR